MSHLSKGILHQLESDSPQKDTYRRKTLRMLRVSKRFQRFQYADRAPSVPYGRKALRLSGLWQGFHPVQLSGSSHETSQLERYR
nr:unnamed protein product [Callosobruchus analis]